MHGVVEIFFRIHLRHIKLFKDLILKTSPPQSRSFERRISAKNQDLRILKKFNMSQMNPKEVFHNTAYSGQLSYIAGNSL